MSQAYTPGLKAARCVRHRARRVLPVPGEVLVREGEHVSATQIVAQALLPGPVLPINVAQLLSIPAAELPRCARKQVGERIACGELLARSDGIFGWFPAECASPATGTVETISNVTGQVLVRGEPQTVQLPAYLAGTVVEVVSRHGVMVEADVTLVQGIFGIAGEAYGPIRMACERPGDDLTAARITPGLRGAIIIGGARVTAEALSCAIAAGVAAIVTGGIDDRDLRAFLGYDLGVATTGSEGVGLTLIITEGFGDIAMAHSTFDLLASRAGADAAVNGATQIRAGVVRPEIVIPWPGPLEPESATNGSGARVGQVASVGTPGVAGFLREGISVRIIRDPWFGMIGRVSALPAEPQVLGSGSKARVVEIRLESGETVVVPRANVELVEA